MSDKLPEELEVRESPPKPNLRMKFGTDYRFHFEEEELRKKGGDTGEFEWIDTTFLEDFIV